MKRLAAFAVALLLMTCMGTGCLAAADKEEDYGRTMVEAAASGDAEAGRRAAELRNERITALGVDEPLISYDDLVLLAQVIHTEAGSEWLPDEWRMAVGEVVLNRVASPEFPNTLEGVVYQPYQYSAANRDYFSRLVPFEWCADAAYRLLCGERVLNEPSVVFQSEYLQGGGVYRRMDDSHNGTTYFCVSNHPELYASAQTEEAEAVTASAQTAAVPPLIGTRQTVFCGGVLDRLRGG